MAHIQPYLRKIGVDLGYYNEKKNMASKYNRKKYSFKIRQ